MSQYNFTLTGKIIPCVRMTTRSKFGDPRAHAYLISQMDLRMQLKNQMALNDWPMLPEGTPLTVVLEIGTDKLRNGDPDNISKLDNIFEAVADAANKIVFPDDRWIDKLSVWRYPANENKAALIVWAVDG